MANQPASNSTEWDRDTQKFATLVWISFLTACVMSLLFFATVDPRDLLSISHFALPESREFGYALGFFFFWAGCLVSGWLSLRLTRRQRQWPKKIIED